MKKYIIQIPETDGVKITNSGYIARKNNYIKIYDHINSPLFEEYKDSDFKDPKPGEEWEYDMDGLKCVIIKEIKVYQDENIYDVILEDNGECESFTRAELIKPTGRTYPKIIEAIKEYVNEANNKK